MRRPGKWRARKGLAGCNGQSLFYGAGDGGKVKLAASTGFEPAIFCVTSRRGRPGSPNSPTESLLVFIGDES